MHWASEIRSRVSWYLRFVYSLAYPTRWVQVELRGPAENKWVTEVISPLFQWSYGPLLITSRGPPCRNPLLERDYSLTSRAYA